MAATDATRPHRRWPTYVTVALVLLFVVYPLSIGPAIMLMVWFSDFEAFAHIIPVLYSPLALLAEALGFVELLQSYIDWSARIAGTT
jgi:hypothetical protein